MCYKYHLHIFSAFVYLYLITMHIRFPLYLHLFRSQIICGFSPHCSSVRHIVWAHKCLNCTVVWLLLMLEFCFGPWLMHLYLHLSVSRPSIHLTSSQHDHIICTNCMTQNSNSALLMESCFYVNCNSQLGDCCLCKLTVPLLYSCLWFSYADNLEL